MAYKNFNKEAAQIVKRRNSASRKKGLFNKFPLPKLSWSSMSFAALLAIIILSTSMFFLLKTNNPAVERDTILQLNHISPNDVSLSLSELIFQWENIPDSDYYTIEVFDDSLDYRKQSYSLSGIKRIAKTKLYLLLDGHIFFEKWKTG